MAYDLKSITADSSFADGNVLFGADDQTSATPVPYTAAGIKAWIDGAAHTFLAAQVINLNAAAAPANAGGSVYQLVGADSNSARYEADSFAASSFFTARRANGTGASPTAIANADQLGGFNAHGYYVTGGPAFSGVQATLAFMATQAWTSTANGTQILLRTTPNNSTTLTTAVTIDQDQSVTLANALKMASGQVIAWNADTGLSRISAGVTGFGTGAQGSIAGGIQAATGAFGGANIGGNAVAVTGTAAISGALTLGTSGILVGGTNIVEQRNVGNAQTFNLYNTTDAPTTNYERGIFKFSGNQLIIGTEAGGTGVLRDIVFQPNPSGGPGTAKTYIAGNSVLFYSGSSPSQRWSVDATGNLVAFAAALGITLKQGANGRVGTFVCNGATPVTVSNTSIAITDSITISLNTVGGTVGALPAIQTITASTGFTVAGTASDTSTYNYAITKNAA